MLTTWRRLMTVRLLALSALGLATAAAFVLVGVWHDRQLAGDLEGHGEHWADRLGPVRPFTVRGERAEQDVYRSEGLLQQRRVRRWSRHGLTVRSLKHQSLLRLDEDHQGFG